ncbi:MAG: branched-chain amino acid ABC transporter substrate-binding protein [Gemmatimonadetes bacterium]|nr:branched-chain amino acid ABC transporter substrate-binding protein [Gemmatimonadota bacterium]MBP6670992.1 branched-chain amino acid ABC transporter substrate-binding protein [Gemmatimonadales bacterium]MBK6782218.1 branched-chain amino acid ABC transporter substrate-binding protein [Gemmatimonadota bacterium]MBK7351943.1 branched-chain amino acid ABC transporter substrate-binding protein [Gemmatimonadota bacterium]MBK7717433.1 branched-chain amino acid ABC transporter substrate-binding pro
MIVAWRRFLLPSTVALACAATTAACTQGNAPVRIGLAGPFTDSVGAPMLRAATLAVEQINAAGGINGRPIELVARDDHGDPDTAVMVATALQAAGVVAVIGHVYSGATLAAAPVYNDPAHPVVQLSPSSSAPRVTTAGEWTFRVCPSDLQYGTALARYAANQLGLTSASVLYANNEYGRGLRQTFIDEFVRLGGRIEDVDPYAPVAPDVGAYVARLLRRKRSQVLVIGGNEADALAVLRAIRGGGVTLPVMGGDGLEGLEAGGPVTEGTYIALGYLPSQATPPNRAFVAGYRARYPAASDPTQAAAASYDILWMLREIIARVGTDRTRIRDAVAAVGNGAPAFEGAGGTIAFDANGDLPNPNVVLGRVAGGRLVAVESR